MGEQWVWLYKDPVNDGNIMYLDYLNVNILAVQLYHSFARCCHQGKLSKASKGYLCYVLQLGYAYIIISTYEVNFKKAYLKESEQMQAETGEATILGNKGMAQAEFPILYFYGFEDSSQPELSEITKTPIESLQFFWLKEPETECEQLQLLRGGGEPREVKISLLLCVLVLSKSLADL